ncbi:MAG: hypothetical protein M1821_005417 [Bathelium mastoideum]|nr:MAG: hypothetical protein M1821_005417 [Bathelium mastoideum]
MSYSQQHNQYGYQPYQGYSSPPPPRNQYPPMADQGSNQDYYQTPDSGNYGPPPSYGQPQGGAPPMDPSGQYPGYYGSNNQSYGQQEFNQPGGYDYNQQHQQHQQQQQQNQPPYTGFPPTDPGFNPEQHSEDRGVMGALAGGAAGAYGGHKMHHGVLGGLAGAYAGHKLEDAVKEHRGKSHSRRSSSSSSSSSSDDERAANPSGFLASSKNVKLEEGHHLVAECTDVRGHHQRAHLDLNSCITNDNGHLKWVRSGQPGNFGGSARKIKLKKGRVLKANVETADGHWKKAKLAIDERIENINGQLRYVG